MNAVNLELLSALADELGTARERYLFSVLTEIKRLRGVVKMVQDEYVAEHIRNREST